MTAKGLVIAIGASAALAGCAHHHGHHHHGFTPGAARSLSCAAGGPACEVWVGVQCGAFGGCSAAVNYDVVVLSGRESSTVAWALDKGAVDAGFTFARDGIGLDPKAFSCSVQEGGRRFSCRKTAPGFGVFKYAVNVTGPRIVPPLDPWVVSEF